MGYTIYLIKENGMVKYVGCTDDFNRRKYKHIHCQGDKNYSAIPVDIDLSTIEIIPIEEYDNETDTLKREDELICEYQTIENGWNKNRSGLVSKEHEYKLNQYKEYNQKRTKTPEYKEYKRKYRKEYDKTYNQTPKHKAYEKRWREEHKEELSEYHKQYRKQHIEKIKAKSKQYYQEHKEELREYNKRWREEHKEKCREYSEKRKIKNNELQLLDWLFGGRY